MPIEFACTSCGKMLRVSDSISGKRARCPACGSIQEVPGAASAEPALGGLLAAPPAEAAVAVPGIAVAPPEPPAIAAPAAPLPATMLANRIVAGRVCPACSVPINMGEAVCNCQTCGAAHHDACWTGKGGCSSPACASPVRPAAASPAPGIPTSPCPACGEPVPRSAMQCPYCGDWISQFPVKFERGRARVWGARVANIRHRDGAIRVGDHDIQIEGMSNLSSGLQALICLPCLFCGGGIIIAFLVTEYLVLVKKTLTYSLRDVVEAVFETDKNRLLLGVRPAGSGPVYWFQCKPSGPGFVRSDPMEGLRQRLSEVLGPDRYTVRESWQNYAMTQDFALNWGIAAIVLPIPFLGSLFGLAALVYSILAVRKAPVTYSKVALGLAIFSLLENAAITWLAFR